MICVIGFMSSETSGTVTLCSGPTNPTRGEPSITSDPKIKPEEQDMVDAETPEDPENEKLTLEELAAVTGGDGEEDSAWFSSPGPWDPPSAAPAIVPRYESPRAN